MFASVANNSLPGNGLTLRECHPASSVHDALEVMFEGWGGYLAERTGGAAPPRPALPVVPLGVDGARAYSDTHPETQAVLLPTMVNTPVCLGPPGAFSDRQP